MWGDRGGVVSLVVARGSKVEGNGREKRDEIKISSEENTFK